MTPAARIQAAIEILDQILSGKPAEQALTGWARRSRFAGSKDRAAVRDHVFDALRCKRSFAARGGGETGRGIMLGACLAAGIDPESWFTGIGHAPDQLNEQERSAGREPMVGPELLDLPDWLWPSISASLGDRIETAARALQTRAPVHLRVNTARSSVADAQSALLDEGITTKPHPACETALEITEGQRRLRQSRPYLEGVVELQDAASQAVVEALPLSPGMRVLDYCAGGGGKALAMAAHNGIEVFAHDASAQRMKDLPARADRAGSSIKILSTNEVRRAAPFDLILCDVPCSGSGSWRRAPEGKWRLTPDALDRTCAVQAEILEEVAPLITPQGVLAYATCSVLDAENGDQVTAFLARNPEWAAQWQQRWLMDEGTDGFFSAHLTRGYG
ncbi:RsmB/NOP family class I SAM-dependent RNA methyltransferase [Primorskyibacter sp. S87]|uniref:RsmB/NOP family class I SAM-dependent RNA methyltransferase n=1 Tax=Primorskyibacter sp. S87 TaxID=3415126 RepID=UPI003C7BAB95